MLYHAAIYSDVCRTNYMGILMMQVHTLDGAAHVVFNPASSNAFGMSSMYPSMGAQS